MKDEEITDIIQSIDNISEPFKVYVRIRPFLSKEIKLKRNNSTSLITNTSLPYNNPNINNSQLNSIFVANNKILYVLDPRHNYTREKAYSFNKIFTEKDDNQEVFDIAIKSTINNVINGYNSTTLAYGVTGTGKTHTIFGDLALPNGEEGVSIKACDYLFNKLNKEYFEDDYIIKVSYIEIYNENVIDLLNNDNDKNENSNSLMIIEDPNKGVYVPNLKEFKINNSNELKKLILQGNKRRTMAPTNQNKFSSRSHAILQLSLKRKKFNEVKNNFDIFYSKFLIVDLAGSERGGLERGKRREEGANINKSLFTLGSCINILSDKNKNGKFIPYRDSKLTRLLKDSLGGNILTVMLVCVSPSSESYEESISSLNYATSAKKIKKKIFQNKKEIDFIEGYNNNEFNNFGNKNTNSNNQYEEIIGSLKNEIYQLKNIIKEQENKLRNKETYNNTLNLDDDSFIKFGRDGGRGGTPKKIKKFFDDESSIMSNTTIIKKQKIENNNNNNINENNINNKNKINLSLIQCVNDINLEKYEIFFNEIKIKNKEFNISELQKLIENIKSDKNNLELFLEQNNIIDYEKLENNDENIIKNYEINEKKYITIKNYYDKFLEVINDKLIENIEQNMILKCNNKEITELNKNNIEAFNLLRKKLQNYKKNENEDNSEHDCIYDNINIEIKNMENTIKENLRQKNEILKTYKDNMLKKKQLKQILLNLLDDKKENSNRLINILKDKEKLVEKNKKFQKIIEKYSQIQKEKDNNINIIQRQMEVLRSQLKEKEKKINELKKINSNINMNLNLNNSGKKHCRRNNSNSNMKVNNLYYIKKFNNNNKNDIMNNFNNAKRSISTIRSKNNNKYINKNRSIKNNKKINNYLYCYDESNEGNYSINNYNRDTKISAKINISNHKKKNNIRKKKCRSEDMKKDNNKKNNFNENNKHLLKQIILKNDIEIKDPKKFTLNIDEEKDQKKNNIPQKYDIYEKNHNNFIKSANNSNKKKDNNKYNNLLSKYKITTDISTTNSINNLNNNNTNNINNIKVKKEDNYINNDNNIIKIILDTKICRRPNNYNLTQKRYEKFMNINTNIYSNNTKEANNFMNNSKKMNRQNNKKLSLNEARYEKKIKNEKTDKRRDFSLELNHANAQNFINSFKGMKLMKNNNLELLENTANFKNNIAFTQDTQNTNTTNAYMERNKNNINTQNLTINMENNCQIETKENDSTNFKTDQSKILKTDDIYQDLINSLKNAPFKFKHK